LSQGYNYLANEEAKTLLDDIYEGRQEPSIKNHAQIECVLKAVDEINNFATQGDTKEAAARAGVLLNNLESLHNLTQVGDDRIDLSRQDFKICKSEFIKEINEAGFIIESCKEFGNLDTFGGFIVWTLRKS
jgi:hypothetical protein